MGNQSTKEDLPDMHAATSMPRRKMERAYQMIQSANTCTDFAHISENDFKGLFAASESLGELLLRKFHTTAPCLDDSDNPTLAREDFISFGVKIHDLTSVQDQTDFYNEIFLLGRPSWSKLDFQTVLKVCMELEFQKLPYASSLSMVNEELIINSMEKSMFGNKQLMDKCEFNYWISRHCPRMLYCLHPYVTNALCYNQTEFMQAEGEEPCDLLQHILDEHFLMSCGLLWALNTYLPPVYTMAVEVQGSSTDIIQAISVKDILGVGGWQLLYDSNTQGLSINRFEQHVMCYGGPTVMFVQFQEYMYCIGSDTEYSEKTERWGGINCFLLQVKPQYRIMQAGASMLYLNINDRKLPKGFYVGKDSKSTMLYIDSDFSKVQHYGIDMPLTRIEVWGCAGLHVLEAQQKQRRWEQGQAEKHKDRKLKVDMEEWKDSPDRQLLELGGVQTEHAER